MFEQVSVEEPQSRWRSMARALPRIGVGVVFILIGSSKFDNDPNGEWYEIFERIGLGQWLRYLTGVMQVSGGLLMVFRRTLTPGAALLACTMAGAALVELFIIPSPIVIVPLLLLMVIIVTWLMA
jgi:uncharacterized membrane protein YphA (DoxX/SURF4 family)